MSLCAVCGRVYCDHTPEERGQTAAEMMRPLSAEEEAAFAAGTDGAKISAARNHTHDPVN